MAKIPAIKVSPSLLAADFSSFAAEIKTAETAGADMLHIDVMDGRFVNNTTMDRLGPSAVRAMRGATKLPLIAHLMVENPEQYVEDFARAGSDMIVFHIETTKDPEGLIGLIKNFNKKAGVSLKPKTKASSIKALLPLVDEVLVMTVEPGFGGQKFMEDQLSKIKEIRKDYSGDIGVDGGTNFETARLAVSAGANLLIAGTYLFGAESMKKQIALFKNIKTHEDKR